MPRKNCRNPGWFTKGYDPRRHALTRWERSLGYQRAKELAAQTDAKRYAWFWRRVRSHYRRQRREGRGPGPGPGLASQAGGQAC